MSVADKDYLFLQTLNDIETKIKSVDPYNTLMIAALLRKLLIDETPLVDQVNRDRKLKITFLANDTQPPSVAPVYFWSAQDVFDPDTSPPPLVRPIEISRDQLLKRVVMLANGKWYTVLDLINHVNYVVGAVHAGQPQSEKDKVLKEVGIHVGGLHAAIHSMRAISRVVLKGLASLRSAIMKTA